jgi:hypothetical protein
MEFDFFGFYFLLIRLNYLVGEGRNAWTLKVSLP